MNAERRAVLGAGALIAAAGAAAYSNSFGVPFIFDDMDAILKNRTIQPGWTLAGVLHGQAGTSALGPSAPEPFARPEPVDQRVAQVWSYHALNLLIHLAAALVLFGLMRRTLQRIGWAGMRPAWRSPWRSSGRCTRCRPSRSPTSSSGRSR